VIHPLEWYVRSNFSINNSPAIQGHCTRSCLVSRP
jgi:hypothetical protein